MDLDPMDQHRFDEAIAALTGIAKQSDASDLDRGGAFAAMVELWRLRRKLEAVYAGFP